MTLDLIVLGVGSLLAIIIPIIIFFRPIYWDENFKNNIKKIAEAAREGGFPKWEQLKTGDDFDACPPHHYCPFVDKENHIVIIEKTFVNDLDCTGTDVDIYAYEAENTLDSLPCERPSKLLIYSTDSTINPVSQISWREKKAFKKYIKGLSKQAHEFLSLPVCGIYNASGNEIEINEKKYAPGELVKKVRVSKNGTLAESLNLPKENVYSIREIDSAAVPLDPRKEVLDNLAKKKK